MKSTPESDVVLPPPTPPNRAEQIANADRAAEQAGVPGVDLPESPFEVEERLRRREPKRETPGT